MGLLGKDYTKEINDLIAMNNKLVAQLNKNTGVLDDTIKQFNSLQEQFLQMALVQAQHKETITFLLNHGTVDLDSQEDFLKMLKNIKQTKDKVKELK